MLAPDGSGKPFAGKTYFFLQLKRDQRKRFQVPRKKRFNKKACNVQPEKGPNFSEANLSIFTVTLRQKITRKSKDVRVKEIGLS
ncbi:MAG: hypothetical protein PSV16_13945 [Flavobacterium sp.]|nr:hypothetical protein [Flavobacterium sp.]